MKVCVLMFYDDKIKSYGEINYEINKKYCEKYNLEIIVSNKKKYEHRHSAWERLPLILDNISSYDYVIWVDADAFFYNDANNIIDIINKNINVNFIFSKDIGNENINTGFFIVKNSTYSIDFLKRWAYDEELYKNNPYPHWWDQGVLINMFNNNILDIEQNSIKMDYGVLQHFAENDKLINQTYIFHLAGRSNFIRYEVSKNYIDKLNGVFDDKIKQMIEKRNDKIKQMIEKRNNKIKKIESYLIKLIKLKKR